jgi:hypothetical protein
MTSENHFGVKTTTHGGWCQEKKNEDDLRKDRIKKTPFFTTSLFLTPFLISDFINWQQK